MKKIQLLIAILTLMAISQMSFGQGQSQRFKMEGINPETIAISKTFTENTEIFPFEQNVNKVFGVAVSADIVFGSDKSVVRLLFVDKDYNEHLIYETHPLLETSGTFSVEEICEETALLNGAKANSVKIEVVDAQITINSLTYTKAIGQGVNIEQVKKEKKQGQNEEKINKINKSLKEKKFNWIAGPTEVSEMTYSERKQLYGQSKFPAGFEYYTGGVISTGIEEQLKSAMASMYVDDWDWRNRHGRNWITPITNQGSCGSCWAFAATGATEAMVNVFFNQQLNLNLSEQDVLSCSGAGDCNGGYPSTALNYITSTGIVDEGTFPYTATDQPCTNKGTIPVDKIKIGGKIDFGSTTYPKTEDDLKRMLIQMGPVSGGLYDWSHAMVLVGYKVVKEGDIFYYRDLNLARSWKTVAAGDPLIGKTVWIFKNSWGPYFGDAGYVYVETPISNLGWTHALKTPVTSAVKSYQVICEDRDGDGYYWWGLGPKPATCATCPATPDGNDADPTLGPLDQYGNCTVINGSPVVNFSADNTSITKDGTVNFTDLSTNLPTSWSWSFTGGTPSTSTLQNPSVIYNAAGTYKVMLTANNVAGSNTKIIENYIQVSEPLVAPVAEFTATKTILKIGESVQFNDLSSNSPTHWQWYFPGGTPETSTEQQPIITYKVAGQYDVKLTVSKDGFLPSEKIKQKYIVTLENTPVSYCLPTALTSTPDYIQNVTIGNILNNSTVGSGYSILANTVSMVPGQSYSVSLNPKVATNRNYWKLWIDFNGDGDFIDSGETLVSVGNKKGTLKTTILIPQNATGTTRMRIAMRTGSTAAPCDGNYKGEVEDYPVTFGAAASLAKSAIKESPAGFKSGILIYPNPVNETLNLQLESVRYGAIYTISNINGEKIVSRQINTTNTSVDFENYAKGIYLLVVVNGDRIYNEKVIKK